MQHVPEIGDHYPILLFEKNENPQNVMVVYTKLSADCRFERTGATPLVDFYWLIDRRKYKPINPMIKTAVRNRLVAKSDGQDGHSFVLSIEDLKELDTKAAPPQLLVKISNGTAPNCDVHAYFNLDTGQSMRVRSVYSESKKTLLPPFRKLVAVTIRGEDAQSGAAIEKRFTAR